MREVGEPVSLQQCVEALRDVFADLKKPDGSHYRGGLERAVHGALWSTGVFYKCEVSTALLFAQVSTRARSSPRVCLKTSVCGW